MRVLRMSVLLWGLAVATALHAVSIFAEEVAPTTPDFELRGSGMLGAVYHNTPGGVQYRRDISQTTNGAAAGQLSFAQDSMLAVQGRG